MTRARLVAAGLIAVALVALFGWQFRRERLVKACLDGGGAWTGSTCGPRPQSPILLRDLRRS